MNSTNSHRQLTAGLILSIAAFAVSANTLPALVSGLARRYEISPDLFGSVFMLQYLSYTICSILSGYLSGKQIGRPDWLLSAGMAVTGVLLLVIGNMNSFAHIVLLMIIIGGCGGLVESNGTALLSLHDASSHGKSIHFSQLFYCLGAMIAPMLIGVLLGLDFSMPVIGFTVGGVTLAMAGAVVVLVKPWRSAAATVHTEEQQKSNNAKTVPALSNFIWFVIAMMVYVMIEITAASWLPLFLEETAGMSAASASLHLTLFWSGIAAVRLVYTLFPGKSMRRQMAFQIAGICFSVMLLSLPDVPNLLRSATVLLLGISCAPIWPLLINIYSKRYSHKHYIMYLISAGSIGALSGPFITSRFFSRFTVSSMPIVMAGYTFLLIIAFIMMLLRLRNSPRVH